MQHVVGSAPAVEAGADGCQDVWQRGKVAIVSGETPSQLPHSLDWSQLRTVGRQEQQAQLSSVAAQELGQEPCVMVPGVVEHDDHTAPWGLLAQQAPQERLERGGVEDGAHHSYELPGIQADRPKAGDRFSGWRMTQDRVLDLGRYPHAAAGTMLLEVTFIQTPQFDVG